MNRKDFLSAIGMSGGGLLLATCLGACSKSAGDAAVPAAPTGIDFTLDISQPANSALNNAGGYVYSNSIIVAKTIAGAIVAVSQACTHQGVTVEYQKSSNQFYCPSHGANFNTTGAVVNGPASSPLKQYTVTVTGNMVRVQG